MRLLFLALLISYPVFAKIKVGVILPLIGPSSSSSCVITKASALTNIEVITYDSGNTISTVITSTQKAIQDKVNFIIAPRTSQEVMVMLDLLKSSPNVISVVPMASHPDITKKHTRVIRMIPSSDFNSERMARLIEKENKNQDLYIVSNVSLPYSEEYAKQVKRHLASGTVRIHNINVISGELNNNSIKALEKNTSPYGIYLPLYTSDVTAVIQQIMNSRVPVKVYTQGGTIDGITQYEDLVRSRPNLSLFINNIWNGKVGRQQLKKYLQIANECKTNPFEFRTMVSFDAFKLIEKKIESGIIGGTNFNVKYKGLLNDYHFDQNRNAISKFYIRKITSAGSQVYEVK